MGQLRLIDISSTKFQTEYSKDHNVFGFLWEIGSGLISYLSQPIFQPEKACLILKALSLS